MPLLFLCQSKTDVVARLIAEFPGLTDQEVVSRLREEYECYIARRTVAYHRGKRVRRNKRHKTAGEATTDVPTMPRLAKSPRAKASVGRSATPGAKAAQGTPPASGAATTTSGAPATPMQRDTEKSARVRRA
jgi:hypothetical protein